MNTLSKPLGIVIEELNPAFLSCDIYGFSSDSKRLVFRVKIENKDLFAECQINKMEHYVDLYKSYVIVKDYETQHIVDLKSDINQGKESAIYKICEHLNKILI